MIVSRRFCRRFIPIGWLCAIALASGFVFGYWYGAEHAQVEFRDVPGPTQYVEVVKPIPGPVKYVPVIKRRKWCPANELNAAELSSHLP